LKGIILRFKLRHLVLATVGFILATAAPVQAAESTPSPHPSGVTSNFIAGDDVSLQRKINEHIAKYGGKQRGKNQIVWGEDSVKAAADKSGGDRRAVLTLPIPQKHGDLSTYARAHCAFGYFCVYEHALWDREGGAMLSFYNYGWYDLAWYGFQYRVSALENNQSDAAWGSLLNPAWLAWADRAWYKADGLGTFNDQATAVRLCPPNYSYCN
jgi:hypothetical protein